MNCRQERKGDKEKWSGIPVQQVMIIFLCLRLHLSFLFPKITKKRAVAGDRMCVPVSVSFQTQVHTRTCTRTHTHTHTLKIFPLAFDFSKSFNSTGRESTTSCFKHYKYFKWYKIYCKNVHSVVLWGTGPANVFSGKLTCALFCPLWDNGGESRGSRLIAWTKQGFLNSHGILNTSFICSFSSPGLGL